MQSFRELSESMAREASVLQLKDPRVLKLSAEDPEVVKRALRELTQETVGSQAEQELLVTVMRHQYEDSLASVWATVALGEMASEMSVPTLLSTLNSDEDFLCEAAAEALVKIARKHGQAIEVPLTVFVHDAVTTMDDYYYPYMTDALVELVRQGSEEARNALVWAFEEDAEQRGTLAGDLALTGDESYLPVLHRALLVAEAYRDTMAINELKYALARLKGIVPPTEPALSQQPWEERWEQLFHRMTLSDEAFAQEQTERFAKLERTSNDLLQKIEREQQAIEAMKLPEFSCPAYLKASVLGETGKQLDTTLRLLGFDADWTVGHIQERMATAKDLFAVEKYITGGLSHFPSERSYAEFMVQMSAVWNETPREELGWLTPTEAAEKDERQADNDRFNETKHGFAEDLDQLFADFDDDNEQPPSTR